MKRKEDEEKNSILSQTNPAGDITRDPRNMLFEKPDRTNDHESSIGNTNDGQMGMGTLGGQFDDERGGGTSGLQYRGNESPLTGDASSSQGDNLAADRFGTDSSSDARGKENTKRGNSESESSKAK